MKLTRVLLLVLFAIIILTVVKTGLDSYQNLNILKEKVKENDTIIEQQGSLIPEMDDSQVLDSIYQHVKQD